MSRRHPKDLILYGLAVTAAAARGKAVAHAEDGPCGADRGSRSRRHGGRSGHQKVVPLLRRTRGTLADPFRKTHRTSLPPLRGVRRLPLAKHAVPLATVLQTTGSRKQPAPHRRRGTSPDKSHPGLRTRVLLPQQTGVLLRLSPGGTRGKNWIPPGRSLRPNPPSDSTSKDAGTRCSMSANACCSPTLRTPSATR